MTAEQLAHELLHILADWPEGTLKGHASIGSSSAGRLLGVSPNTLHAWERRYGFPTPERSSGGKRRYNVAQLLLLRQALRRCDGDIHAALALLRADIEAHE